MIGAPIVVGVDGSSAATDAARWAAMWAQRAGRPLRLLSASASRERRGLTSLFVRETAAVLERHPDLSVDCVHECADASAALIEASRSAEAVVVGSRGAGGWEASRIGGVARDVSAYARCVVAIVPPGESFPPQGPVVVGVDGSPESEEAAEFAARQACAWRRDLLVVTAYPADGHLASSAASGQSVATGTTTQTVRTAVTPGAAGATGATGATGHARRRAG
uniref:universal stress protein n=1 Tax=Piscicoccus intestinalis TaxID=746033 RepID=UPI000B2A629E